MRWVIEGADRATGATRKLTIDAKTPDKALGVANSRGILVARIDLLPKAPRYIDLWIAGAVVGVFSLLCYALGAFMVLSALTMRDVQHGFGWQPLDYAGFGLTLILIGAVLHLFRSAAMAVRDIARK